MKKPAFLLIALIVLWCVYQKRVSSNLVSLTSKHLNAECTCLDTTQLDPKNLIELKALIANPNTKKVSLLDQLWDYELRADVDGDDHTYYRLMVQGAAPSPLVVDFHKSTKRSD